MAAEVRLSLLGLPKGISEEFYSYLNQKDRAKFSTLSKSAQELGRLENLGWALDERRTVAKALRLCADYDFSKVSPTPGVLAKVELCDLGLQSAFSNSFSNTKLAKLVTAEAIFKKIFEKFMGECLTEDNAYIETFIHGWQKGVNYVFGVNFQTDHPRVKEIPFLKMAEDLEAEAAFVQSELETLHKEKAEKEKEEQKAE